MSVVHLNPALQNQEEKKNNHSFLREQKKNHFVSLIFVVFFFINSASFFSESVIYHKDKTLRNALIINPDVIQGLITLIDQYQRTSVTPKSQNRLVLFS